MDLVQSKRKHITGFMRLFYALPVHTQLTSISQFDANPLGIQLKAEKNMKLKSVFSSKLNLKERQTSARKKEKVKERE